MQRMLQRRQVYPLVNSAKPRNRVKHNACGLHQFCDAGPRVTPAALADKVQRSATSVVSACIFTSGKEGERLNFFQGLGEKLPVGDPQLRLHRQQQGCVALAVGTAAALRGPLTQDTPQHSCRVGAGPRLTQQLRCRCIPHTQHNSRGRNVGDVWVIAGGGKRAASRHRKRTSRHS